MPPPGAPPAPPGAPPAPLSPVVEPTSSTKPDPTPAPVIAAYVVIGLVAAFGFLALALGFCCATTPIAAAIDCERPPDKARDPIAYARWQRECERRQKTTGAPTEGMQLLRIGI